MFSINISSSEAYLSPEINAVETLPEESVGNNQLVRLKALETELTANLPLTE
jgi:hypothetical protein